MSDIDPLQRLLHPRATAAAPRQPSRGMPADANMSTSFTRMPVPRRPETLGDKTVMCDVLEQKPTGRYRFPPARHPNNPVAGCRAT